MTQNPWDQPSSAADDPTVPFHAQKTPPAGASATGGSEAATEGAAQPAGSESLMGTYNPAQQEGRAAASASHEPIQAGVHPQPAQAAYPAAAASYQQAAGASFYQEQQPSQNPDQTLAYGAPVYYTEQGKKKHSTATLVGLALLAALIGGGVGGAVTSATSSGFSTLASVSSGTTIVNNTDSVNEVTAAAAKATPSTVTISAASSSASGSGSGVILDGEGHILTNTHVVTLDGATANASIEVQLADGTVRTATVVGTDPTSDLAVIKLDDISGLSLTPATLGDSDNLNVGDTTVAIGAPLGLSNTVTTGVVSNLVRTIEVASSAADESTTDSGSGSTDPFGSSPFQFEIPGQQSQSTTASSTISINVIQTDAAVNPGNSGGALINASGEVIGINVAIASTDSSSTSTSGSIGVGFAIPINYAKRVAQEIIDNGSATHGLLGATVTTSPANNDSSEAFGDGTLIREVSSGGAAEKAGLKANDVVVAVNGRAITDATELTATVRQAAAGEEVTLTVQRNGQTQDIKVTLGQADS
ncbi:S1C family serine protease [Rothia nasimurium]|uniref:S1C family serine protease n=1 Tax=Rothia nasimurium TaxID=85336 RepID=UPI001F1F57D5|nr:trypsin-like peptidase domain-containing protein [Rothia nasimurium]